MTTITLPPLPREHGPTLETLHAYAQAVAAVTRAHGIRHPKWWHLGLKVRPDGLVTDPVPLPGGDALALRMDLRRHHIVVRASTGAEHVIDLGAGATSTEMGDEIIEVVTALGLDDGYDRSRFESDEPRIYHPSAAEAYFAAFTAASTAFEKHRVTLGERVSPIQVWPHGFDLAFEWFGTRSAIHEGEEQEAQLNLGFYPADPPYFYSNPWPFDEGLVEISLPHGAVWNTEGWQGAMLPYDTARQGDAAAIVGDFARAVYEAASPTLTAG